MHYHIKEILTRYWGYSAFRPLQEDIIMSVLEGNDTLALMPTGGGKSICFQVPAMAKEGICIVISPLIALIKDQVTHLKQKGIPAVSIVSGMSRNEIEIALDNCTYGKIKFLYITPERLITENFQQRLGKMKVNLLAIDEAHCISQWGYDFRPPYLQIAEARKIIPDVPVLALTATATSVVKKDIQEKLLFKKENIFQQSFERKNLSYVVIQEENKIKRLLNIIGKVGGTGIIYARNRKKTREISQWLNKNKISAGFYHAGLDSSARNKAQEEWMSGKIKVIVSTNAFGMGIDKSNVRFVVHLDLPDSLEAYYQEAGRAGRDGEHSYAVLLINSSDLINLEHQAEINFPEVAEIRKTYQALANYYQIPVGSGHGVSFDFDIVHFCKTYNLQIPLTYNCLKILALQGLLSTTESVDLHPRIHITTHADELYEFQVKYEKFDHFIKTILRSYGGVFDDYVIINEKEISERAGISKEETVTMFSQLDKLKVISYLPSKDSPQIVFLTERLDARDLRIDRQNLADRKQKYLERVKAMIEYSTKKTRCRSMMLLKYFGEETEHRCGNCDYCLQRNKLGVSDLEFTQVRTEVKSILQQKVLSLDTLLNSVKTTKEDKALRVIEWLIDNKKLKYVSANELSWNGN